MEVQGGRRARLGIDVYWRAGRRWVGLVLVLGVHSTRIVAEGWRSRTVARLGEGPWKGLYSLLALVGLARAEMRVALHTVLQRMPDFTVEEGVEYGPLEGGMVMALTRLPVRFTPPPS